MGFKTFSAGDVLTAADVNDFLMEQSVIVCTSGTRPASPHEGMRIYETDTKLHRFYNGSAWRHIVTGRPFVQLSKTTASISNNSVTEVSWDTEVIDTHGMWSTADRTAIFVPIAGHYIAAITVRFASQATAAGIRQVRVNVNGAEDMQLNFPAPSNLNATNIAVHLTWPLDLAANDDVGFSVFQNSGGALNIVDNTRVALWLATEG